MMEKFIEYSWYEPDKYAYSVKSKEMKIKLSKVKV